uniref:(northern house mosquito) hypothetical protein n=1 Tax=Culex pipiens TaxID=7175 RepID=A0A8D7ZYL3_CULPI
MVLVETCSVVMVRCSVGIVPVLLFALVEATSSAVRVTNAALVDGTADSPLAGPFGTAGSFPTTFADRAGGSSSDSSFTVTGGLLSPAGDGSSCRINVGG